MPRSSTPPLPEYSAALPPWSGGFRSTDHSIGRAGNALEPSKLIERISAAVKNAPVRLRRRRKSEPFGGAPDFSKSCGLRQSTPPVSDAVRYLAPCPPASE